MSSPELLQERPVEETQAKAVSSPRLETIPIGKIMPHPDNPRGPVDPADAQAMADSLREVGQMTAIKVRPLCEEDKARFAPFEYLLLGGHVRLEGAKLAGLATLLSVVLPARSEDEEELDSLMDNRSSEMSWWRWDLAIERRSKRNPGLSNRQLAAHLELSHTKINSALKILAVLTPSAREVITAHLTSAGVSQRPSGNTVSTQTKLFLITEGHLEILADLKDLLMVEKAVKTTLDRKLTEAQAKKLVEWVLSGQDLAQYQPAAKAPKAKPTPKGAKPSAGRPQADGQALSVPVPEMEATTSPNGTGSPSTPGGVSSHAAASQAPSNPRSAGGAQGSTPAQGSGGQMGWELLAGMSLLKPIQQKLKAGQKPTIGEGLLLIGHFLVGLSVGLWKHVLRPILKFVWGIAKKVLHWSLRLVKDLAKALGGGIKAVFTGVLYVVGVLLIIAVLGWSAVEVWKHGFHLAPILRDFMELVWGWARFLR